MRLLSSLLFLLVFSSVCLAQKESNIWMFGDRCGLDFSSGVPVPVAKSAMSVSEGCASISSANGTLLFYTNGVKVWTRENKEMLNGKNLKGHDSSTQSALPVSWPGNPGKYILFTSDVGAYDNPPNNGIHYSVIDMSRNLGWGDVTTKNKLLLPLSSEKLTSVDHANGQDVWVIAHGWNTNNFYAWLVTKEGVAHLPVLSTIGSIHSGGRTNSGNAIGQMKLSPDGKRLAVVMFDSKYFELFDFDDATGKVSNNRMVYLPTDHADDEAYNAYGIEFSPNSTRLYIGQYWKGRVIQYNPSLSSGAQIMNEAIVVGRSADRKLASLQLASDGKIYVTKDSRHLGIISKPNEPGLSCGYVDSGIDVKNGKPQLGLPSFNQSYFRK